MREAEVVSPPLLPLRRNLVVPVEIRLAVLEASLLFRVWRLRLRVMMFELLELKIY